MPEASKSFLPNLVAAIGYALTFAACILGSGITLTVMGLVMAFDLLRGAFTGTFRERLRKPRW